MAEATIARNCNIVAKLDSSTQTKVIQLYSPGFLNPYEMNNGLKYSGFINSLRATVKINSINELITPSVDQFASTGEIDAANRDLFATNAKKCFSLMFGTSTTPAIELADIYFYNQKPYYYVNLLNYLTGASGFSCASDGVISIVQKDAGYGLLSGDDSIVILGSVIEEAFNSTDVLALEI